MTSHKHTENGNYFNLHTSGVGYVNCIREVPVKGGNNFWACYISALHGKHDAIHYTRFDCRVMGSKAEHCIKKLQKYDIGKSKILIGFTLGNLQADLFTHAQGSKKGESGVNLKANLLFIAWVKVDGNLVYKAPSSRKKTARETVAA